MIFKSGFGKELFWTHFFISDNIIKNGHQIFVRFLSTLSVKEVSASATIILT